MMPLLDSFVSEENEPALNDKRNRGGKVDWRVGLSRRLRALAFARSQNNEFCLTYKAVCRIQWDDVDHVTENSPRRTRRTRTMEFDELSNRAIGCAIEVHSELGPGLLESTYEQCLAHELKLNHIHFKLQHPLPVEYKGIRPLPSSRPG